ESEGQDGPGYEVYARTFLAAGIPLGQEFRVNTYTSGDQRAPEVRVGPEGTFIIGWQSNGQDGSGDGIYAQQYQTTGIGIVELQADPCEPGKTMLVVQGTDGDDRIIFKAGQAPGQVLLVVNSVTYGPFAPTGRLVAYGRGGNDEIRVNGLGNSAWLYGGDGQD